MRWVKSPCLALCLIFGVGANVAAGQEEVVDFSDQITPTCEMAGLVARPPEGWFNVPFENPPAGHLGCQMMATGEDDGLIGIIRVRSATAPATEFGQDGYAPLLGNENVVLSGMGYILADEPLWRRDDVPVSGVGFREGRAVGVSATIEGNDVPQEAQFLLFRSDDAKYVFTLLTPAESFDAGLYKRNTDDFGVVIRTLQPSAGSGM